ncbi:uncharacterized protein LOC102460450 [Pelodiscus sinensis]|uniref:uncharacterized protein LOC102460450 n=1 Tax=Pelodiscus sinensis TaxID=13735 RepID=UPI003F6AE764
MRTLFYLLSLILTSVVIDSNSSPVTTKLRSGTIRKLVEGDHSLEWVDLGGHIFKQKDGSTIGAYLQGLTFMQNELWRCRAGDRPLGEWSIPRPVLNTYDTMVPQRFVWTHFQSKDLVYNREIISAKTYKPLLSNSQRWEIKLPVFRSQLVTIHVEQYQEYCHLTIRNELEGNILLYFVMSKDDTWKNSFHIPGWLNMTVYTSPLRKECRWIFNNPHLCLNESMAQPVYEGERRCLTNCKVLVPEWKGSTWVYLDVLYRPIIKPGRITWVIKFYHDHFATETAPATVVSPEKVVQSVPMTCVENKSPQRVSSFKASPSCKGDPQPARYVCTGIFVDNITESGTWNVLGIFGAKFPVKILVAEEPEKHEIGPYVVKTNMARQVLIEPEYHVKWVHVPLSSNTADINNRCEPFVEPLVQGWYKWLQLITISNSPPRTKRDIAAKVLGGVGAGMGVASATDNACLSKSLARLTAGTEDLVHPLEESLLGLDKVQLKLTDLLPKWANSQEEDHLKMLTGMQVIINDTALALACIQMQNMLFDLSRSIIRDALALSSCGNCHLAKESVNTF